MLPVKVILSTPGCAVSAAPAVGPKPARRQQRSGAGISIRCHLTLHQYCKPSLSTTKEFSLPRNTNRNGIVFNLGICANPKQTHKRQAVHHIVKIYVATSKRNPSQGVNNFQCFCFGLGPNALGAQVACTLCNRQA